MDEVVRIDAATNSVGLRVPLDGPVASDGTEVWIGVDAGPNGPSKVVRIDPVSGKVITRSTSIPGHRRPGRRPRIRLGIRRRRDDPDRRSDGTHRRAPRYRWRWRQRRRGGWRGLGHGGRSAVRAADLAAVIGQFRRPARTDRRWRCPKGLKWRAPLLYLRGKSGQREAADGTRQSCWRALVNTPSPRGSARVFVR